MTITDTAPAVSTQVPAPPAEQLTVWEGHDATRAIRALRAAMVARSRDATRPALGSVQLVPGSAVATDSYCLAIVPLDYQGSELSIPPEALVPIAKTTSAELRKADRYGQCTLTISSDGMQCTVSVTIAESTRSASSPCIAYYPEWRRIVPTTYAIGDAPIGLNAEFLARTAAIVKILGDATTIPLVLVHSGGTNGFGQPSVWELRSPDYGTITWLQMQVKLS